MRLKSSNHLQKPLIICLMGPTAIGKTDLAIRIAERYPVHLISVDSAMIYRGMNIGTGKPDDRTLTEYPHALVDICDPTESYSVADFCQDAVKEIEQAIATEKIPLLVGGTMMYFHALQQGLSQLPSADPAIRKQIEQEAQALGWGKLHQQLTEIDPKIALNINPNDPQRIQRALEIYYASKQLPSELFQSRKHFLKPYQIFNIALVPQERARLHDRIAQRFEQMLQQGFEQEVYTMFQRTDLSARLPAIRCVGYRQMWSYFTKEYDYETMREKSIAATRQLAKRQLTWLKGWEDIQTEVNSESAFGSIMTKIKLQ